jgi:hypothetical protein
MFQVQHEKLNIYSILYKLLNYYIIILFNQKHNDIKIGTAETLCKNRCRAQNVECSFFK